MSIANPFFRWLKPDDLTRVAKLQLLARDVVDGLSGGLHRSRHIGASVDFKEHRPYVHGDEIRSIDWKLFGKTDRLYIRQFEDETNLRATIVVDQSGSMRYCGTRAGALSKHEYAVRLAACLAFMLIAQQDTVGLVTFDTAIRKSIPPRSRPNHLQVILESMADSRPGGETDLSITLQQLLPICRRRGLVILISDLFGEADSMIKSLSLLRANFQEVILFQIWDPDELDFPFQSRTLFRSLEDVGDEQLVDPASLRATYLENLKQFREALRLGCQQNRIDLIPVLTTEPFSQVVANYVARRGMA